jgi:hypothetical protein
MPMLIILCSSNSFVMRTVVTFSTTEFKPLVFPMHGFAFSYAANMFVSWFCMTLTYCLHNIVHSDGWKSYANSGPVWSLENFQWCRELCLAGSAIQSSRYLLIIPRRGKHKSLLLWLVPYRGLVECWLSALRAGRPLPPPPGRFLVFIPVRGWANLQDHGVARIR